MLTLSNEIHFWSSDENIIIKPTDYGSFKYYSRKESSDVYSQSKKIFCEKRGLKWHLQNKRPHRLKDRLKDFEDLLPQSKIVSVFWEDNKIQLLLSKGYLVTIAINWKNGDLVAVNINKQLGQKLHTETVYEGILLGNQLICICSDGRLLGVGPQWRDGWTFECGNKRHLSYYREWLVVWGKAGAEHPQPWSPIAKDHERANLNLFYIGTRGPELLAYRKTDGEPILIVASKMCSRAIVSVEQKVSQRGAVSVEVVTLELIGNILKRVLVTLVPLQTQVSCCALSENEERLLLGCIDGSVAVLNRNTGSTRTTKASFIPTFAVWHQSGIIMSVANDKGQMQYFDCALNSIYSQLAGDDCIPSPLMDFSGFFNKQIAVDALFWGSTNMLVCCEHGPVLLVRHTDLSLDLVSVADRYLSIGKTEMAIALLLSWEFNQQSFMVLQKICAYLMKLPLINENAQHLQDALGCFHSPASPIATAIRHKFGSKVQSLTRRFFHQLVRAKMFETAFLLAVDLSHHDLFMDLYYVAVKIGETEMAAAARAQASALLSRCSSEASDCSRSSCSQCSETGSSSGSDEHSSIDNSVNRDMYTDNCLTTNFNSITPKTYVPSSANVPPVPNVDLPKISAPRVSYVKPPTVPPISLNKPQVTPSLLAPPLPFVPSMSNINMPPKLLTASETLSTSGFGRTASMPSIAHAGASAVYTPFQNSFSQPYGNRLVSNYPESPFMFSAHSSSNLANNMIKFSPIRNNFPVVHPLAPPSSASVITSSTSTCTTTGKKQQAKVKFSDTVTAFIVPEVKRPPRPTPPAHLTDPQKELADSLPLCHPNEDYLKDFAPVKKTEASQQPAPQSKIKVVHFGVV